MRPSGLLRHSQKHSGIGLGGTMECGLVRSARHSGARLSKRPVSTRAAFGIVIPARRDERTSYSRKRPVAAFAAAIAGAFADSR